MSKFTERIGGRGGLWTAAALAAGVVVATIARGDDPKCEFESAFRVQGNTIELTAQGNLKPFGIPLLSKLPFVGQMFECAPGTCQGECRQDHLQCAGIDVDIAHPAPGRGLIIVKRVDCQQCAAECDKAKCGTDHCCECEALKATVTAKHAAGHAADDKPSWEQIVGMAAEKAALEAALEGHEAIAEAKDELFESLADLMSEKAVLEAKLEFQSEREELSKQVQKLAAENAHLKAQVELASARMEMLQKTILVAAENEHLKHRVAELERQGGADNSVARTAKRNQSNKKAR